MISLAQFSLLVAFLCSLTGLAAGAYSMLFRNPRGYLVARRVLIAVFVLVALPTVVLMYGFMDDWMSLAYVVQNSSPDLPEFYKFTALWAGQSGSLLFWSFVLALFSVVVVLQTREDSPLSRYHGVTVVTLVGIQTFFLYMLYWVTHPFEQVWQLSDGSLVSSAWAPEAGAEVVTAQAQGMNPLLMHPGMAIHPPTLYFGYIGLAIPFAFAIGALVSGRTDNRWVKHSRLWTILCWTILSFGIVLGGWWAYQELGWGGYWAWDPVENASFMPWLLATAFLHSIMIQEKRNMLKRWNVFLICGTFVLSIFGTFLTRSGLLTSVHTFAQDPVVGNSFMVFLGLLLVLTSGLVFWRWDDLDSDHELESIFSREFAFLMNNILFVGICFAVFWGTTYPIISEAVTGERVAVGPSFFNQVTVPMFLGLLLLTGIGPMISWRRASPKNLLRNFTLPTVIGLMVVGILWLYGIHRWMPLASFGVCAFVATTVFMEFWRGVRARRNSTGETIPVALLRLTWRARRRFGGYVVHFGIILMAVGITASSAFSVDTEQTLAAGETMQIRDYELEYVRLEETTISNGTRVDALIDVYRGGERIDRRSPGLEFLSTSQEPRARVDIRSTLTDDLYLVLAGWTDGGDVTLRVYHNPLVSLIWIGVLVLVFGGLYAFIPRPGRG